MRRLLVTGALGQIGSELVTALRVRHGESAVVASDIRVPAAGAASDGPFVVLDVTNARQLQDVVRRHDVGTVYHLAALLSATSEERPQVAWDLNLGGLYKTLEVARENRCAVFFPSSIAAFGPTTPKLGTPQDTIQRPTTIYGVTKVAGELLADYYALRFGVDVRGLRFPGLISYGAPPGGGTTDYAVAIFYEALRHGRYDCFLGPESRMDMMYMPDAIRAVLELMDADPARLAHRNAFNISAMSFTPEELAAEIRRHLPAFEMRYDVEPVRQAIADSWPQSLDDSAARAEWGWRPEYDLAAMTADMIVQLRVKLRIDA
ncbi:MAG TPA: L-threonine 3-dehydrogenase [Thermoanaerobaculia bacterium]|nr:L-threonine 3-dehydrogenase [Thermoanaerobaculia bacterium]